MSINDNDISTDPSDYSDIESSSQSSNESFTSSLSTDRHIQLVSHPIDQSITNNNNSHKYPCIQHAIITHLSKTQSKHNHNNNSNPSPMKRDSIHSCFERNELEKLCLDELLAKTMSIKPNIRWNIHNEWCRYCGARASTSFLTSPWGPKKLCYIHHKMWKNNTLNLSIFEEPTGIKHVINNTECTEKQYLIDVLLKLNNNLGRRRSLRNVNLNETESYYSSEYESEQSDDNKETIMDLYNKLFNEPKRYRKNIECRACDERFSTHIAFREHMKEFHGIDRPYTCDKCPKSMNIRYANKAGLNKHQRRDHEKRRDFKCLLCPKAFFEKSVLESHQRVHDKKKPYKCSYCGIRCTQKCSLRQHIIAVHLKQKNYKCCYCNKAFASSTGMKSHSVAVHNDDKYSRFQCNQCYKRFYEKGTYIHHQKNVHRDNDYIKKFIKKGQCFYANCDKKYTSKNKEYSLKYHLATKHKDRRFANYECKRCDRLFYDKTRYNQHLNRH